MTAVDSNCKQNEVREKNEINGNIKTTEPKDNSNDFVTIEEKSQDDAHAECDKSGKIKDSYSVYNYLVKTPSVLIAALSGLLAMLSFIINYATYLKTARMLHYWGVDTSVISTTDQQFFYTFCFAIIFLLISIFVSGLIANSYISYAPFQECILRMKKEASLLKKANAERVKSINKLQESFKTC